MTLAQFACRHSVGKGFSVEFQLNSLKSSLGFINQRQSLVTNFLQSNMWYTKEEPNLEAFFQSPNSAFPPSNIFFKNIREEKENAQFPGHHFLSS